MHAACNVHPAGSYSKLPENQLRGGRADGDVSGLLGIVGTDVMKAFLAIATATLNLFRDSAPWRQCWRKGEAAFNSTAWLPDLVIAGL